MTKYYRYYNIATLHVLKSLLLKVSCWQVSILRLFKHRAKTLVFQLLRLSSFFFVRQIIRGGHKSCAASARTQLL